MSKSLEQVRTSTGTTWNFVAPSVPTRSYLTREKFNPGTMTWIHPFNALVGFVRLLGVAERVTLEEAERTAVVLGREEVSASSKQHQFVLVSEVSTQTHPGFNPRAIANVFEIPSFDDLHSVG